MFIISFLVIACTVNDPLQIAANDEDDYGIGGTGIVGSVTGFGSIFVNGIEVEITDQTVISVNGQGVKEYPFQIGDTVEILARDAAAFTHALRLNIRHEIIGPISSWDKQRQLMQVLGQKIQLADETADWIPGQFVAVAGYLDHNGVIQARRVDRAEGSKVLVRGDASNIGRQLNKSGITIAGDNRLSQFNGAVQIEGKVQQQQLDIQRIQMQALLPFRQVKNWRIEGYPAHYSERWPELKTLENSGLQLMQFELQMDVNGEVSVQQLEAGRLRRGAQQYHAPVFNRSGFQGNRQSSPGTNRRP